MEAKRSPARHLPPTIGRYRVLERLGRGAMGIVYSAYDDVMERPVAIKVMTADLQDDPETSARFSREAHAAGQLVHRNIITIFDMGEDDGRPYIVMELLEGQTLDAHLQRAGGVPIEEKISLITQLCEGLHLAHGKGIFHRDIKPGNLLVSESGALKIVDFGIARLATSSMTVSGLIVGTPDYMSPEQACGREVDQRSDIFSAGAVAYFALTGRKPFGATELPAVLHNVQHGEPLPIRESEAPPALIRVVMKALAKPPGERYQKIADMVVDLGRALREVAGDTRTASDEARRQLDTIDALAGEYQRCCAQLAIAPTRPDVARFRETMGQRYPSLFGPSLEVPLNATAKQMLAEVSTFRQALSGEVTMLAEAVVRLHAGTAAAASDRLPEALQHFEFVRTAVPACEPARQECERILRAIRDRQAAVEHARALLVEAQAAADRRDWVTVIALTTEKPQVAEIDHRFDELREQARAAIAAADQARRAGGMKAQAKAEKFAAQGRYADAEPLIEQAKSLDPQSPALLALEERVLEMRLAAERASESAGRVAQAIASARATFASGARDTAIADLRAFAEREPHATEVAALIDRLSADSARMLQAERQMAEASELARAAEVALEQDHADEALAFCERAMTLDRSQELARRVQGLARARAHELAAAERRRTIAENALQSAAVLSAAGKFAKARKVLRSATGLTGDPRLSSMLSEIDRQDELARLADQRAQEARERQELTEPLMALARAAETACDFARARWVAESALALDLGCEEARSMLGRIEARLLAQPELSDDTIKSYDGVNNPDDTVTLHPVVPAWSRVTQHIKTWMRTVSLSAGFRPGQGRVK